MKHEDKPVAIRFALRSSESGERGGGISGSIFDLSFVVLRDENVHGFILGPKSRSVGMTSTDFKKGL